MSGHTIIAHPLMDTPFQNSVRQLLGFKSQSHFTDPLQINADMMSSQELHDKLKALIRDPDDQLSKVQPRTYNNVTNYRCDTHPCLLTLVFILGAILALFMYFGGIGSSIKIYQSQESARHKILKISLSIAMTALSFVIIFSLLTGLGPKALAIGNDDSPDLTFLGARLGLSTAASSLVFFICTLLARQIDCIKSPSDEDLENNNSHITAIFKTLLSVQTLLKSEKQKGLSEIEKARLEWVQKMLQDHMRNSDTLSPSQNPLPSAPSEKAIVVFYNAAASPSKASEQTALLTH